MPRSRATIACSSLADPDFRALPALCKYLYWSLLAQTKLTIAGCLDLKTARWAELSPDTPTELIDHLLDVLEGRRYVAIDRETDELVIRTFVKHDVAGNKNSQRGVWGAWQGIESPYLRAVVVANIPDAMWSNPDVEAPAEAQKMRGEPLSERLSRRPIEHPISEGPLERSIERATEPPCPSPVPPPTPTAVAVLDRAARLLAERDADRHDDITDRQAWVRKRAATILASNAQDWRRRLDADASLTAEQLVTPKPSLVRSNDPLERTAAAAQARYDLAERQRRADPCETCHGAGQVELNGGWLLCASCNGTGVAA